MGGPNSPLEVEFLGVLFEKNIKCLELPEMARTSENVSKTCVQTFLLVLMGGQVEDQA